MLFIQVGMKIMLLVSLVLSYYELMILDKLIW